MYNPFLSLKSLGCNSVLCLSKVVGIYDYYVSLAHLCLPPLPLSCCWSDLELSCSVIVRLLNYSTRCCTVAGSIIGIIQPYMFESNIDSQKEEENLFVQGHLWVQFVAMISWLHVKPHPRWSSGSVL